MESREAEQSELSLFGLNFLRFLQMVLLNVNLSRDKKEKSRKREDPSLRYIFFASVGSDKEKEAWKQSRKEARREGFPRNTYNLVLCTHARDTQPSEMKFVARQLQIVGMMMEKESLKSSRLILSRLLLPCQQLTNVRMLFGKHLSLQFRRLRPCSCIRFNPV